MIRQMRKIKEKILGIFSYLEEKNLHLHQRTFCHLYKTPTEMQIRTLSMLLIIIIVTSN